MNFWIFLWKAVLILGMLLFAGMAIWVTIGGFFDIKRLFARIDASHKEKTESQQEPPPTA